MKNLAIHIGIDYDIESERNEYSKMLREMVNLELPDNYLRFYFDFFLEK